MNMNIQEILNWLSSLDNIDTLIVSLDTIAYGGLVSSRRCNDSFNEIKKSVNIANKIFINFLLTKLDSLNFSSCPLISCFFFRLHFS